MVLVLLFELLLFEELLELLVVEVVELEVVPLAPVVAEVVGNVGLTVVLECIVHNLLNIASVITYSASAVV